MEMKTTQVLRVHTILRSSWCSKSSSSGLNTTSFPPSSTHPDGKMTNESTIYALCFIISSLNCVLSSSALSLWKTLGASEFNLLYFIWTQEGAIETSDMQISTWPEVPFFNKEPCEKYLHYTWGQSSATQLMTLWNYQNVFNFKCR